MSRSALLLEKLKSLNLVEGDFAVFGSGPMHPRGIKEIDNDIDIVARGKAWEQAQKLAEPQKLWEGSDVLGVKLFDEQIEIANGWGPGEWDLDKLIDEADIFDGIRYVNLSTLISWKKRLGRPKDLKHIELIKEYLKNHSS